MRMYFASDWINQLLVHQVITKFHAIFTERMRVMKANQKLIFHINIVKWKLIANAKKFGSTLKIRIKQHFKKLLSFMHIAQASGCKDKAQITFVQFMRLTSFINEFNTKVNLFTDKIARMQQTIKRNANSLKFRKITLQTAIWTNCIQKMSNCFISNARKYPQPFMKDIGMKLPFIDEKIKVRIV